MVPSFLAGSFLVSGRSVRLLLWMLYHGRAHHPGSMHATSTPHMSVEFVTSWMVGSHRKILPWNPKLISWVSMHNAWSQPGRGMSLRISSELVSLLSGLLLLLGVMRA